MYILLYLFSKWNNNNNNDNDNYVYLIMNKENSIFIKCIYNYL